MTATPHNLVVRELPQAIEAEQAALGIILTSDYRDVVLASLRGSDYYTEAHRRLFAVFSDMHRTEKALDLVTAGDELERRGELERVGGLAYLASLTEATPTPSHADYYCRLVREASGRRQVIATCSEIQGLAYDGQELADLCAKLGRAADLTLQQRGLDEPTPAQDLAQDAFRRLFELDAREGLTTGLPGMDRLLFGWQEADQITLAGRPAMGKTAAALHFARSAAQAGAHVLFFSLEMSKEQLTDRLLSTLAKIPGTAFRQPQRLGNQSREQLTRAISALGDLSFTVEDRSDLSMREARAIARRWRRKATGTALVVLDYLQLLQWPENAGKESENTAIEWNANECKRMAKDLRCPVLVLSQLNRNPTRRDNKRPQLQELRGSGGIEQAADVVLFIHRDGYYEQSEGEEKETPWPQPTQFLVGKNRNGATGNVWCQYDAPTGAFWEEDQQHEPPPERRPYGD